MEKYNREMESAVLAAMILDTSIIDNVINSISEQDFFYPDCQRIFNKIVGLHRFEKPIDILALSIELPKDAKVIAGLTDVVPTAANWEFYVDKVKTLSKVREACSLKGMVEEITEDNVGEKTNEIIKKCIEINNRGGVNDIKACRDLMLPVLNQVEQAIVNRGGISGLDSSFDEMNELLDGIQNELILIGARPSIGKTAFGVNMFSRMAKKGITGAYFSLEMSGEKLMMRVLSDFAGIQARALKDGMLSTVQTQKVCEYGAKLAELPMYIIDTLKRFDKIVAKCRYLVRVKKVQIIFIDHASIIQYKDKRLPRNEQYAQISSELQSLQRELKVPIILMCQLGRGTEGKPPCVADLRESGAFEQDADEVILMHRERYRKEGEQTIETQFLVEKNRDGPTGIFWLDFMPEYIRFRSKKA